MKARIVLFICFLFIFISPPSGSSKEDEWGGYKILPKARLRYKELKDKSLIKHLDNALKGPSQCSKKGYGPDIVSLIVSLNDRKTLEGENGYLFANTLAAKFHLNAAVATIYNWSCIHIIWWEKGIYFSIDHEFLEGGPEFYSVMNEFGFGQQWKVIDPRSIDYEADIPNVRKVFEGQWPEQMIIPQKYYSAFYPEYVIVATEGELANRYLLIEKEKK